MRLTSVPLTSDNLRHAASLWGDGLYSPAELERVMNSAAALLTQGRARGTLLIDEQQRPCFYGMTAFVPTGVADDLVANPSPRIGHRLLGRCDTLLDVASIGRGNAGRGLHLVVLSQGHQPLAGADWAALLGFILQQFEEVHRGFRLLTIIGEIFGAPGIKALATNAVYPQLRYFNLTDDRGATLPSAVFSITKAQAIDRCSPLLSMFAYDPPRVHFTASEQLLLREALAGATDTDLARRLNSGLAAIKSRWKRAYERIAQRAPDVLPPRNPVASSKRGAQVRHIVLEFVRKNPGELTPFCRRLPARERGSFAVTREEPSGRTLGAR